MSKRYRYIVSGRVTPSDEISSYRMLDKQKLNGFSVATRVTIPDNVKLEKWSCDEYSTWDNSQPSYLLKDLDMKIVARLNGEMKVLPIDTTLIPDDMSVDDVISDYLETNGYAKMMIRHIGYVTPAQLKWYYDNYEVSWRLSKIPNDLQSIKIPELTKVQLDTLDFVRTKITEYFDESFDVEFEDWTRGLNAESLATAKAYLKDKFDNMDNDELAFKWHQYSTTSLDDNKVFETKEMVDKMRRSKVRYVRNDHYMWAVVDLFRYYDIGFIAYIDELRKGQSKK